MSDTRCGSITEQVDGSVTHVIRCALRSGHVGYHRSREIASGVAMTWDEHNAQPPASLASTDPDETLDNAILSEAAMWLEHLDGFRHGGTVASPREMAAAIRRAIRRRKSPAPLSSPDPTPDDAPDMASLERIYRAINTLPSSASGSDIEAFYAFCGELPKLRTEVARLREENAELRKDGDRLDWFAAWRKGDSGICPPGNHGGKMENWLVYRDDDSRGDRYGAWAEEAEGATLREAIDAARGDSR